MGFAKLSATESQLLSRADKKGGECLCYGQRENVAAIKLKNKGLISILNPTDRLLRIKLLGQP